MQTKNKLVIKKWPTIQGLVRDPKKAGVILFVALALLLTWSGVKIIGTNYELQKQISSLGQEVDLAQLENDNMRISNQYLLSDSYLEQSARLNFGLALPGEIEVIIPKEVALAQLHDADVVEDEPAPTTDQSNFDSWLDFFLHRQR